MYKILSADKDAYINNRFISQQQVLRSNTGAAGSLDLFKLYGISESNNIPNTELSRLLIHFNISELQTLHNNGLVQIDDPTFKCFLELSDVYGGQPTPKNFIVTVHPLSRSFDEGIGRDIVRYDDNDVCNYLTSSMSDGAWILSGAGMGGPLGTNVDYLTSFVVNSTTSSLEKTMTFTNGDENLYVDVTQIVSATIKNLIPDHGFRVAFTSSLETNDKSYFVKRFASRTAYNADKHPKLIVQYDDSIIAQTDIKLDTSASIFLYNYANDLTSNIVSSSVEITGSNSLKLRLETDISGGLYAVEFSGSQYTRGTKSYDGMYYANVYLPSTQMLNQKLSLSSSIRFTPIWSSNDGSIGYHTGSHIYVKGPSRGDSINRKTKIVTLNGLKSDVKVTENIVLRVNIFDTSLPSVIMSRIPRELPGEVITSYYSVRDVETDVVRIPFDRDNNSTKISSDGSGMYFKLDCSNLIIGRLYTIDIMLILNGEEMLYREIAAPFRIIK